MSYANLHSPVIMWHGCGCNSTSIAWPHSDLSSPPHCWDVLLEQPHTCYHFGRALDTSVVRICCAGPTDLHEFRHVLVFLTIIPVQCGITQRTFEKQDQPILIYRERTWEQPIHMNRSVTFRSSSSGDAPVWSLSWSPSLREDEFFSICQSPHILPCFCSLDHQGMSSCRSKGRLNQNLSAFCPPFCLFPLTLWWFKPTQSCGKPFHSANTQLQSNPQLSRVYVPQNTVSLLFALPSLMQNALVLKEIWTIRKLKQWHRAKQRREKFASGGLLRSR